MLVARGHIERRGILFKPMDLFTLCEHSRPIFYPGQCHTGLDCLNGQFDYGVLR